MTRISLDRRTVLKAGAATAGIAALSGFSAAALAVERRHGLSVFGELKYAPGFESFDYINPDAPKGGTFTFTAPSWAFNQNPRTFNTFNSFILKGDAPPRMELCFDTLMVRALDEPDAVYGLVAEAVEISGDGATYLFHLRPEARFHDGSPLRAEDVAFSFNTLKADGHPIIQQSVREFVEATAEGDHTVSLTFSGKQTVQLPIFMASSLPIFSKAYYSDVDFTESTLTPPLSSGPYKVGRHEVGRYIEYARVDDWWGKDLAVAKGHHNFDAIRLEFFRDRQVAFEAFKKGATTFQEEFSSKIWATEYNFPAVEDGRVIRKEFADNRPAGAQGWFFNTRREKFADPLVRRALGYAFDFEWSNQSLFYGLYTRTQSFFQNSDMMADGLPSEAELALLEPFRDKLPESVFGPPLVAPTTDGTGKDREPLRIANDLLKQAGLKRDGRTLLGLDGKPFTIEFLNNSPAFERIINPFIKNLKLLGIEATFRLVDPAQYQSRLNDYDFDVAGRRYSLSATLSDSVRQFWNSESAKTPGSYNIAGIADPVVDHLIEAALSARTRNDMTTAAKALDRVLRSGYYWVPQWNKPIHTVAIWDMFGYPEEPPFYDFPVESTWWLDEEKARKVGKAD